jgi:nucleotide-binding universal stress UspA family protein
MKSLFVPVDFSSNAETALRYAVKLSQAFPDATIHITHLLEREKNSKMDATCRKLEDFVRLTLSHLENCDKVTWTVSVHTGGRLKELIKTDTFQNADLVVMGTKGANGFLKELRGSNTYEIVRDSNKPVLVVPGHAVFTPLRHILYCSDFEQLDSFEGLSLVKELAQTFNAEVRIAHVKISHGESSIEHTFESKRQAKFFEPEVKNAFKIIRHKTVLRGIHYYLDLKRDNQLVVMVKREHGLLDKLFMENNTREMVFHSALPLLVIGEK